MVLCIYTLVHVHRPNEVFNELFKNSLATDVLVNGYPGTLTTLTSNIDINELLDNLEPGVMNRMCAFEIRFRE